MSMFAWVDEAADINQHQLDAMSYLTQSWQADYYAAAMSKQGQPRTVDPLQLHCRKCKAEPGQPCKRWSSRHQQFCRKKSRPHELRYHDARLATEMYRALKPD